MVSIPLYFILVSICLVFWVIDVKNLPTEKEFHKRLKDAMKKMPKLTDEQVKKQAADPTPEFSGGTDYLPEDVEEPN